ncbi:MAG TPA: hypothetical protein VF139_11545 [Candidatus Polarisedimenticolaceae bacterium]
MVVHLLLPIVLAAPAGEAIGAAIAAQRAGDPPAMEAVKGEWESGMALLAKAESAHAVGRDLLALERLTLARTLLDPLRFVSAKAPSPDKVTPEIFDRALAEARAELERGRAELEAASSAALPAAVRALRDDARVQSPIYARTAPMWRENGDYFGGVFYVGSAVALARAAAFDAALQFRPPGPAPRIAPLQGVVDDLERELVRAYVPPVSKDRHREFISASAALKTARDLLAAGSLEGALYEILRARLLGAPILRAGVAAPEPTALRESAAVWRTRLDATPADSSLARLFLEKAEAMLDDAASSPEAHANAAAILDDVLPEYVRRVGPDAAAAASVSRPQPLAGAEATVTLVRWPYT